MRLRTFLVFVVVACFRTLLHADVLLFDRGLPTANLNNAAGALRSNVAWGDYSPWDGKNWAIGDDFNLGLAGSYNVTDVRVWIVGTGDQPPSAMWTDLRLFGGPSASAPGGITQLSAVSLTGDPNVIITPVTYTDGEKYQGSSGRSINIWQIDFLLNWQIDGNTTYSLFVGDTPTDLNKGLYPPGVSPFLHASNAALSGSQQQGADNKAQEIGWDGSGVVAFDSWDSNGNGWDKSSDINMQIFGTPEPTSVILLGTVGLLVAFVMKKKHEKGLEA